MGTALITGASSGLGVEYAWQLAAAGHHLVLVARRAERLEELAEKIRQAAGVRVEVLARDLSDRDELSHVANRLRAERNPVGLLVNNAGFGLGQRFVTGDLAKEEKALDVLIRAVMVLSHAAAGPMANRGRGAILNVSSVAAGTSMGTYAAAKVWVKTFTEVLAGELRGTGVSATAVLPGLVRTEFHEAANMNASAWPEIGWIPAEAVVEQSLAAVRRGQVLSVPTVRYKAINTLLRHAPRGLVRAASGPGFAARAERGGTHS